MEVLLDDMERVGQAEAGLAMEGQRRGKGRTSTGQSQDRPDNFKVGHLCAGRSGDGRVGSEQGQVEKAQSSENLKRLKI